MDEIKIGIFRYKSNDKFPNLLPEIYWKSFKKTMYRLII